jgi:hypothetical protein
METRFAVAIDEKASNYSFNRLSSDFHCMKIEDIIMISSNRSGINIADYQMKGITS